MRNILSEKPKSYYEAHGFLAYIMKYLSPTDITGRDVLDVGCGFGSFVYSALSLNPRTIYGIDVTAPDVQTASEAIRDPRAHFKISSALDLPFDDGRFDTITSWEVLEHIPRNTEDKYFSEIFRVLKPGGSFYLSTPRNHPVSCILDPAWILIGHRHYSEKQLREFATRAGFQVSDLSTHGDLLCLIFTINLYVAKWIFRRKPFFQTYFDSKSDICYSQSNGGIAGLISHLRKPETPANK